MNLYQAGYTRKGKQGWDSGWDIVFPSADMPTVAKDGFRGFAGNLAMVADNDNMPKEVFGVFRRDPFLYFMNTNYRVSRQDIDPRGVSFTHGYCIELADYYELCKQPEKLLGVREGTFRTEYDPEERALPTVDELAYEKMDPAVLRKKYGLDKDDSDKTKRSSYCELLYGVTCALEGYMSALCIKTDRPLEEYGQVCREVIYLIMRGLPYHLRPRLTFCSYKGGNAKVYFSDKAEGNHYFDLETKEWVHDESKVVDYAFTLIYKQADQTWQNLLKTTAEFIEETFDVPLENFDCGQMELAFHAKLKNPNGEVDTDLAITLLRDFLSYPLKEGQKADEYLAFLLECISRNRSLRIDDGTFRRVVYRAQKSANQALREAYLTYYAGRILASEKSEGHNELWGQYIKDKEQYEIIVGIIKKENRSYYEQYYVECFLPGKLKSFQDILEYLEEESKITQFTGGPSGKKISDEAQEKRQMLKRIIKGDVFYNLLKNATDEEIRQNDRQIGWTEAHDMADKINFYCPEAAERYKLWVDFRLWEKFKLSDFFASKISQYREYNLNQLALEGYEGQECKKAQEVKKLVAICRDSPWNWDKIYKSAFVGSGLMSADKKKQLQWLVQNERLTILDDSTKQDRMDKCLFIHYNFECNSPEISEWVREMRVTNEITKENLSQTLQNSRIQKYNELKQQILTGLEVELGSGSSKGMQAKIQLWMKEIQRCLKDTNSNTDYSDNSENTTGYCNGNQGKNGTKKISNRSDAVDSGALQIPLCLCRVAVGYLAITTIVFSGWCIWNYLEKPIWALVIGIVAVLGGSVDMWLFRPLEKWRNRGSVSINKQLSVVGVYETIVLVVLGGVLWGSIWLQDADDVRTAMATAVWGLFVGLAIGLSVAGAMIPLRKAGSSASGRHIYRLSGDQQYPSDSM